MMMRGLNILNTINLISFKLLIIIGFRHFKVCKIIAIESISDADSNLVLFKFRFFGYKKIASE